MWGGPLQPEEQVKCFPSTGLFWPFVGSKVIVCDMESCRGHIGTGRPSNAPPSCVGMEMVLAAEVGRPIM